MLLYTSPFFSICAHMTAELATIVDCIRYAASRFNEAGLTFGHSHDNAIDEATHLVLSSLHLPPDLPPAYGQARLTAEEKTRVLERVERYRKSTRLNSSRPSRMTSSAGKK